jgi:hypothetical protein
LKQQIHTGLLKTNIFFVLLLLAAPGFSQKGFRLYAGAGVNTTFCPTLRSNDIRGTSKGVASPTFNGAGKLKLSRHFSMMLQYARVKSHINVSMKDIKVYHFDRYAQQLIYKGDMSFIDDLYMTWHQMGLSFNYEIPFKKSNLLIGIGINQGFFNSNRNFIARHYQSLPANSAISDIEKEQASSLQGPNVKSASLSLAYERLIYSDRLGIFGRIDYYYNFNPYSFDYKYSNMGLIDGYDYYETGHGYSDFKYYSFSFQTLNITVGAFYNINFKANEKSSTN